MGRVTLCLSLLVVIACGLTANAQSPPVDTFKIDYFANANTAGFPDGTVRITNAGTSGGSGLCAAIFVFNPIQEMTECCSCYVSANGLRTLSVNTDLTDNPLIGIEITTGTIQIVSSTATNGTCSIPIKLTPSAGIRSWTTHLQNSGIMTETPSSDASLSAAELTGLTQQCHAIEIIGSGRGICTCGSGD